MYYHLKGKAIYITGYLILQDANRIGEAHIMAETKKEEVVTNSLPIQIWPIYILYF